MIVAHHFSVHGDFVFPLNQITANRLWIQLIAMGGKIGVDIFVLISGYFLIECPNIKIAKCLKLWLQMLSYSLGIYICYGVFSGNGFHIGQLIRAALPIASGQWWFASTYFVLYLISPLVNKLLRSLDKKTYQKMIVAMLLMWSIIPTMGCGLFESNSLIWFICLYSISGYIRLWDGSFFQMETKKSIGVAVFFVGLSYLSVVVLDLLGMRIPFFGEHAIHFYGDRSILMFAVALFLFIGFKNWKFEYHKYINVISSATFGVYLIHDHGLMRGFLWWKIFRNADFAGSPYLVVYSIAVICLVYAVCTILELLRKIILEERYVQWLDGFGRVLGRGIDSFFDLTIFDAL